MPVWTRSDSPSARTVYERPLGIYEKFFYWDSIFDGTADILQHAEVEIPGGSRQVILDADKVTRTWISLKREFPLLGAQLQEREEGSQICFVVNEERLQNCSTDEITFHEVASQEEAQHFIQNIVNGQRQLSSDLISRLYILPRTDQTNRFHVLFYIAHLITDGTANMAILRVFLDRLSFMPEGLDWDLEERLALAVPAEEVAPGKYLSVAKRRWREAIGRTISAIRLSKISVNSHCMLLIYHIADQNADLLLQGGHTLPRKLTKLTPYTPARSGFVESSFTTAQSAAIIQNCRKNKITFGNAYPVLGQLALTRVLCRRYIRGEIGEEEWDYRRKEPMTSGGPLSLRSYLDPEWLRRGGSTHVCLSISFFFYTLPFMPLGSASKLARGDPVPAFDSLLSPERFLLRCNLIKRQAGTFLRHPLFLEIGLARLSGRVAKVGDFISRWRRGDIPEGLNNNPVPVVEQALESPLTYQGGSSLGNVDKIVPQIYPLQHSGPQHPVLHLIKFGSLLRCRPAELYLGAKTTRGQLVLHVFFDRNVYDEEIAKEWLEEVKTATLIYLGNGE